MNELEVLKKYFGYDKFRAGQEQIIKEVMDGKDVVVLMPTGGGKSLCYQMPALMKEGVTLVVSPLIALMKDQVDQMKNNGISAEFINSSLPTGEIERIQKAVGKGEVKILYVAPERLVMESFINFLKKIELSLIAVDEAHCISEWGHDFRPDYRNLKILRENFPKVSIMALTATATGRVKMDIVERLELSRPKVFISSFNRKNLKYIVRPKKRAFENLRYLIEAHKNEAVIIYCFSRRETEEIAARLKNEGYRAGAYHAGLDSQIRKEIQEKFINDEIQIMVATIAFGMGIDKPDVRMVVHYSLPKSIESYYQETGRAGRDGLPSDCVLFYSYADTRKHEYFIREISDETVRNNSVKKLREVVDYCELRSCRREYLLNYFGETKKECRGCDNCLGIEEIAVKKPDVSDNNLFEKLRALRKQIAQRQGVPPYVVFNDVTLKEMAAKLPRSESELLAITGVGREKLKRYGQEFLEVINRRKIGYLSITYQETKALWDSGLKIEEIAKRRRVTVETIINHLEKIVENGGQIEPEKIKMDSARLLKIKAAFEKSGQRNLKPVKDVLGEDYSYEEIRLGRLCLG